MKNLTLNKNVLTNIAFVLLSYIVILLFCNFISGGAEFTVRKSEKICILIALFLLHRRIYKDKIYYAGSIICLFIMYFSVVYIKHITGENLFVDDVYKYMIFSFAVMSLFLLVNSLLTKWRIIISIILLLIILLPVTMTWSYYFITHTMFNPNAVLAIMQTNMAEAYAYVKDYSNVFNYLFIGLFGCLLLVVSWKLKQLNLNRKISVFLVFLVVLDIFMVCRFRENILLNVFTQAKNSLEQYEKFKEVSGQRKENIAGMLKIDDTKSDGVYVLVIGESQNKNHMTAYGYDRDTTPWLNSMKEDKNFLLFKNAYSCHTHTVQNLTYALTAKNQYNELSLENAPSVIEVAEAAGFDTAWLSNQVRYSAWDTPVTVIANEANQQIWVNENLGESTNTNFYDEKLVDCIDELKLSDKMLIVIHLMGNHGGYGDRYPKEFNRYGENNTIDEYDNSILYNDYVVENIYNRVKEIPNFKGLIYFADHADDVDRDLGHDSGNFTFDMARIPLYMYCSNEYVKEHGEIFSSLKNSTQKCFTNDLIFNTVLAVMDIRTDKIYEPQNDLTNKLYDDNVYRFKTLYGEKNIADDGSFDR